MEKKKGFLATCKEYFGFLPGQGLKGFADEMSNVDMIFRREIHAYFQQAGVECETLQMKLNKG